MSQLQPSSEGSLWRRALPLESAGGPWGPAQSPLPASPRPPGPPEATGENQSVTDVKALPGHRQQSLLLDGRVEGGKVNEWRPS